MSDAGWLQLPLPFDGRVRFTFDLYQAGPNSEAVRCLKRIAITGEDIGVYLWGANGTGKSHLLQALCRQVSQAHGQSALISLREARELSPQLLNGLESMDVVCLDDIQAVAGNLAWEQALFHLYDRTRDARGPMIVTGRASPQSLDLQLPDLKSRLVWGLVFRLAPLGDSDKRLVLRKRASAKGLDLPPEVVEYLFKRVPRDMPALCRLLDRLDTASLAAQRRVTIPFVRRLLAK